jgi:hypothetical protein
MPSMPSKDDSEVPDATADQLAYRAIALYIEHTQIAGLLVARLASEVGEARLKPIAESELWQAYMASKRALAEARTDIESLTALIEAERHRHLK